MNAITDTYLSVSHVAGRLGISKSTVWRWVKDGHLPAPVKLGPGCTRWRASDLEAALSQK